MMAALEVFAGKGYEGASNRDIAAAAGMSSPGLIYHYFPSKLDLLRAIVTRFSVAASVEERREWLLKQEPEVGLTAVGMAFMQMHTTNQARPLIKVILGEALKNPEFAETMAEVGPLKMLGIVKDYLEVLMERGKLRKADSVTAARAFMGAFVASLLIRTIWAPEADLPANHEEMVRQNVDIFLRGMAA